MNAEATDSARAPDRPRRRLTRDTENALLAGVLAGVARRLAVDPILIRVGFGLLAFVTGGLALVAYVAGWLFMDTGDQPTGAAGPKSWAARIPIGNWRVAAGVGFLTLAALLVLREVGLWWSDALIWPLILAASGAALLWRQSRAMQPGPDEIEPQRSASETLRADPTARSRAPTPVAGIADVYRGGFGVALVLGAALIVLSTTGALEAASDALITALVVVLALVLILAPFLWRLGRNLAGERAERIRSQERADVAAHLHDSVLQTLTLMQRQAEDPRAVAQLARRQERELRSWLFQTERRAPGASLAASLEDLATRVEEAHGVQVEVVAVGDAPVTEAAETLLAAAGEAMVNAAKFAPEAGEIAVYAELDVAAARLFVRDRGPGFELAAVPPDRQGVRESILGRIERAGGRAEVRSRLGAGTEVELSIDIEAKR